MKWFSLILACLLLLPALRAESDSKQEKQIDRTKLNSLGSKMFKDKPMVEKRFFSGESSVAKKMYQNKQLDRFTGKTDPTFSKELALKKTATGFDKNLKPREFSGLDRKNTITTAQQRYDVNRQSSLSSQRLASENGKISSLSGKKYSGREADIIRGHLTELQRSQYQKLDLDDSALSLKQIREMLNKD